MAVGRCKARALLPPPLIPVYCLLNLVVNCVHSIIRVCTGACVCVYALRVVSPDGTLHNKDTLIIITNDIKSILYDFSKSAERKSPATKYLKTRGVGGRGGGVEERE